MRDLVRTILLGRLSSLAQLAVSATLLTASLAAQPGPFDGERFHGRIAWSADGNHNDEDDWAASPFALAIFAAFGVQDNLVHFDYNSILNNNDPAWERTHEESVLGAARRFGYDLARFHNDQQELEDAVASLVRAIDDSSDSNPLYLVIAGPMEVAYRALQQAKPERQRFVYCISHSNWNDGFSDNYKYNFSKHDVIGTGIKWVQIRDQNRFLSKSPFGRPARDAEWAPFHWLRDAEDENLRFLWQRLETSTRADCSDAGMAYFLMTGDEESEIGKVRALLEHGATPAPLDPRDMIRLEAENARILEGLKVVFNRRDRDVSHRMHVRVEGVSSGRIGIRLEQPYTASQARYDVKVRYFDGPDGATRYRFYASGRAQGAEWTASADDDAWRTHTLTDVAVTAGDELTLEVTSDGTERGRVDYMELRRLP